jgi:universal stress protein A
METYKRILAAVDLAPGSAHVVHRAHHLAAALGAELRLVHVVPPLILSSMPSQGVVSSTVVNVADIIGSARMQLEALGREVDLPGTHCQVVEGTLRNAIVSAAQESAADLIVVGNNERHGVGLLLNKPTGDSVSRRAPCDILEIRLAQA